MAAKPWKLTVESPSLHAMAEALETKLPAKVLRCANVDAPTEGASTLTVREPGSSELCEEVVTWTMEEPEG